MCRCAVPFRLAGVTSARTTKCTTYYVADGDTGRWSASGGVWFTVAADSRSVQVIQPTGGNAALLEIDYPYDDRTTYFWVFYGPLDHAAFRSLVAAFAPTSDEDPHAWPSSLFS